MIAPSIAIAIEIIGTIVSQAASYTSIHSRAFPYAFLYVSSTIPACGVTITGAKSLCWKLHQTLNLCSPYYLINSLRVNLGEIYSRTCRHQCEFCR
ncbi:hypothetical protein PUN28_019919 [Cardiocondyla obscurior]|uniref:Secreted protein n=1 Tax=Cardiocondyla obscurior TaxID=286306 RepID=A0AAW2EA27_9HYME